ncbi:hypothetical protein RMATCC62417_16170 [Rhizopus microsporus]|nr:hypothetical protein RMATCC62417_16170 [Rhizopus microsporus]
MQIKENTFIVTGGGLGEATVRELIKRGANVAIFDLNDERAEELAKELGSTAFAAGKVDVTSEEAVRNAIERTINTFGRIAGALLLLPKLLDEENHPIR